MRIKCFGIAKEIINQNTLSIEDDTILSVQDLRRYLENQYPRFSQYKSFMIAVNQTFALDTDQISSDDEIAIIPPVSGG